jgi:galactokinase
MSIQIESAKEYFRQTFNREATVVARAPGRVNVIGEHTDYNHGFVLPMAIEREAMILAAPRENNQLHAFAVNMDASAIADLNIRVRQAAAPWLDYVVGVADELTKIDKPLVGADLMIIGDVPLGCGLSSSAALEMAALCMFESLGDFSLEGPAAAQLGQRVENDFLGLSSGIMDQFISRCGKADHALFLDCRSLDYELIPVAFPDALFVIANTCCSRGLTSSKYNERVNQCQAAVKAMQTKLGKDGSHLRDFTLADLETAKTAMDDIPYRRARHVITEDERTQAACQAMRQGDAAALGKLMDASDTSLREDYEVTSEELDAMADIARNHPACQGSRMTGAGFGGCTINLVQGDCVDDFCDTLMKEYAKRTGLTGEIIISKPAAGAGLVEA